MAMPNKSNMSLKLLIETKGHKVLFAEAGKDFVDFLFSLLRMPIGTVIRLLTKHGMVGCLGHLYQSIEELSDTYIQSSQNKDVVLKPEAPLCTDVPLLLLPSSSDESPDHKFFGCSSHYHRYVASSPNAVCPGCRSKMDELVTYVSSVAGVQEAPFNEGGFVKGVVTYMVMDNLEVKPMSTISSITLLNKFNVENLGSLEERVVEFDMTLGLKLLEISLHSEAVLTTLFLGEIGD
uniref:Uncharacterized protein LOC103948371 n=1 Tax=Rhizophora mucronata TaxID=61149 RepID=A0A2P2JET1_RHIMU